MHKLASTECRTAINLVRKPILKSAGIAIALTVALIPRPGHAGVIGFLGNFDVINDTGLTAHGFEIELEGLHSSDITDVFGGPGRGFPTGRGFDPATSVERYGSPTITDYLNGAVFGARVTYTGLFDGANWDFGTPSGTFITPGDNCWSGGGVGYGASTPCDHFGVGTSKSPSKTTYNWLLETSTPGTLTNGAVNLPAPVFNAPPQNPANPPAPGAIGAAVQAPLNEQDPNLFGDAMWVKVFTTELPDVIGLEELVADNAKVEGAETEIEWQLLQYDPGNPDLPPSILESGYGAPVGANAASILRRYEFFDFSGEYDPETHEALPTFSDSHPNCSVDPACLFDDTKIIDLGHYIGAQNVAANLVAPVPIPAAVWLFGSALGCVGLRRRRSQ